MDKDRERVGWGKKCRCLKTGQMGSIITNILLSFLNSEVKKKKKNVLISKPAWTP